MLVAAAMAWLSRLAFKLESDGKAALRQAAFEENVRLALWRMDSTLSGLISMENARPYESYPALIHATPNSANALAQLYFQFDPKGRLILSDVANLQNARWDELRRKVTQSALLNPIQYTTSVHTVQKATPPAAKKNEPVSRIENRPASRIEPPISSSTASQMQRPSDSISVSNMAPQPLPRANADVQQQLNLNEASARESIISQNILFNSQNMALPQDTRSPTPNLRQGAQLQNALPAQSQNVISAPPQNVSPARSQNALPSQFNDNRSISRNEPPGSQMQRLSESISGSNAAAPISRARADVQKQLNRNEANVRESIVNESIQLNYQNIVPNQITRSQLPIPKPAAQLAQSQNTLPTQLPNALPAQSQNALPTQFANALPAQSPNALPTQLPNALPTQSQSAAPAQPQNASPAQPALPREAIQTTKQDTSLEMMNPIWLDKDLFLVRRAYIGKQEYIQGCWLDWPSIRTMLLRRIEDLLPHADLAPLQNASAAGQTRLLASIPVMLFPGPVPEEPHEGWSILYMSLSIAWAGVLLATFAVAIVLRRTMELNQRRGAFVSAVTHELRTPLTTFRLYTEMLDAGMVTEDAKRKQYYSTLHGESERLSHLVENVLMYAQLENSRGGAERIEAVRLVDLKERMAPSLSERAMQSGMELSIEIAEQACHATVRVDISAVERILFNLVDNAGKYGRADHDPRILLSIALKGGMAALSVCDCGPGIAPRLRKKLFLPFSKSASEAANSAPGVGLGLSISRGLARQMQGDLQYDFGFKDGACFVLTLPLA
jgi:signal transduction histidine kinase